MVKYTGFGLNNGLQVYVHEDHTTSMAVVNLTYNVGSKDENEYLTGFAHLFEHLMFGGSKNAPSFDHFVQEVGGECNAFTSPDITNYYVTLPAENIETAFWLESDRMSGLSINSTTLDVQRKVVIEEYKQRYLNQPYGDMWLKTLPLAYQTHPYRWATIGREIAHIADASLDDVRAFYKRYYCPANAVLVVSGNVTTEQVRGLSEKWFGELEGGVNNQRSLPRENVQTTARSEYVEADVPLNALTKVYHMPGRFEDGFFEVDLLADILGKGKSSRLYSRLVKTNPLFSRVSSKTTSSLDPGLLVIKGFVNSGIDLAEANAAIEDVLSDFVQNGPTEEEVTRVKNQSEASFEFAEVELLNRAMNLAYAAIAGDPDFANKDIYRVREVQSEGIKAAGTSLLKKENCSTLYYTSKR